MLDECALPKRGCLSTKVKDHQSQEWFQAARQQHPAIESAISHLQQAGWTGFEITEKEALPAPWVLAAYLKRLDG